MTGLGILVCDPNCGRRVAEVLTGSISFDGTLPFGGPDEVARLPAGTYVTFVVPVLGEDELVEPFAAYFEALGRIPSAADKLLNIVLAGDVHPSDSETVLHTVIARQINSRLRFLGNALVFPKKLAEWNTAASVDALLRFLSSRSIPSGVDNAMSRLSSMLQALPVWTPAIGMLELVDTDTAASLLAHRPDKAELVTEFSGLPVRRLGMPRAGLRDFELKGRLASACLTHLDLSSNALENLDFLREQLPRLVWVNLAANALESVDLSVFPNGLRHLYLHKNQLTVLGNANRCPTGLKTLSIYRNKLSSLPNLGHLQELTSLNLGANPISDIPEWVGDLVKLSCLGLAQTEIEALPDWIFASSTIQEIDLCGLEGRINAKTYAKLKEMGVRVLSRNMIKTE